MNAKIRFALACAVASLGVACAESKNDSPSGEVARIAQIQEDVMPLKVAEDKMIAKGCRIDMNVADVACVDAPAEQMRDQLEAILEFLGAEAEVIKKYPQLEHDERFARLRANLRAKAFDLVAKLDQST